MKHMKNKTTGQFAKVSNAAAKELHKTGEWAYIPKSKFKCNLKRLQRLEKNYKKLNKLGIKPDKVYNNPLAGIKLTANGVVFLGNSVGDVKQFNHPGTVRVVQFV